MRRPKSVRRRRLRRIWTQLRKELTRQVSHQPETWSRLRRYAPALASFGDPVGLLAWFRDPLGDRERKNVAYRQLLDADGRDQAARALARNIAWLGLWPALDRFVRRDERSGHDPATVAADYSFAFLTVVERFDGSRVNRVAATIVMNTARVVAELRNRQTRQIAPADLGEPISHVAPEHVVTAFEISTLRRELQIVVGDDADFIILSVVVGMTCDEIAALTSMRAATVNKRLLRAMHRLRRRPWPGDALLSDSCEANGFYSYVRHNFVVRCPNHWPPSTRPIGTKQVGTTLYCGPCADFLLDGALRHLRGWSCAVSGDEGAGICPACLVDVFRMRGVAP